MIQEPPVLQDFEKKPGRLWTERELADCRQWLLGRWPELQERVARIFAKWPTLSPEDAADALNSFFLGRLNNVLRIFDPDKAVLFNFVLFCLTRDCKATARRRYERQRLERLLLDPAGQDIVMTIKDPSSGCDPLESLQNSETRRLLQEAVSNLREDYQQVLRLRLQGKSYDQIAFQLVISVSNVKIRLHRARHELRLFLLH